MSCGSFSSRKRKFPRASLIQQRGRGSCEKKSNLHARVFTCLVLVQAATINLCSRCIRIRAWDLHDPPLSSGDKFWISGIHSRIAPVNLLPGLNFEDSKREQWKFVPALDDQINLSWKISNFSYFWQKKKQHHLYIDATIIPYHIFIIQFQEYTTTKRKE